MRRKEHAKPRRLPTRFIASAQRWLRNLFVSLRQMSPRRWGVHLATLAMALLTLSLLFNFTQQVIQSANLEAERAELEAEVAELRAENARMEAAAEHAESDAYVERIARERLGYAREGDIVILAQRPPEPETPAASDEPAALPTPAPLPNWQGWWDAFTAPER
jgi:cell division protein FtsB